MPETEQHYQICKDGQILFTGTKSACHTELRRIQHRSAAWALQFGGYTMEPCPALSPGQDELLPTHQTSASKEKEV